MKTRNQLSSSSGGGRVVADATIQADTNGSGSNEKPDNSPSSSTPRLRDRRSPGTGGTKSLIASAAFPTAAQNKSPSPAAAVAKRLSTGPTRILPVRRSCGRHNSLLADNQPNSSAIANNKTKLLLKSTSKSPEPQSSRKDTHKHSSTSLLLGIARGGRISMSNKIDTIENNINQTPSTSRATLVPNSKHNDDLDITHPESSSDQDKQAKQLVCISIPDTNVITKSSNINQITPNDESGHEKQLPSITSTNTISNKKTFNLLIGVSGSIAAVKLVELTNTIKSKFPRSYVSKSDGTDVEASVRIKIVMTKNSLHFTPKNDLISKLSDPNIEIYDDSDEWSLWNKMEDPVLHIELRKWADLLLIAPLSANTMAKLANGICENLLTCVVRAWEMSKPLIYCPAMNVHMYNHPITREHLCKLQSLGYFRVDCVEKRLACGDFGMGGMASVDSISNKVVDTLVQPVTRRLSLTKPLLNQQPTYPIISLTEDYDQGQCNTRFSPSISNQILNRFRTNNQITIHPVINADRVPDQTLGICAISAESRLKRHGAGKNYIVNDNQRNGHYITINNHAMGGVTSVQNLKAIGLDNNTDATSAGEDELGVDFDPSNLLEQSMVTDDSIMVMNHDQTTATNPIIINPIDHSWNRSSSFVQGGSRAKIGTHTPLFNTSKFLALCYNKERGCFTCTICKHDYKNRKSMARHLKEQHVQGNIYHCKPCGVSYKRREKLVKHNRERHQVI